jgi:hypothetical protein
MILESYYFFNNRAQLMQTHWKDKIPKDKPFIKEILEDAKTLAVAHIMDINNTIETWRSFEYHDNKDNYEADANKIDYIKSLLRFLSKK